MAGDYLTAGNLPALLTGTLLLVLAGFLLVLNFRSSSHRIFSLFLVCEAASFYASGLTDSATTYEDARFFHALSTYGVLASGGTLLYFLTVYPKRRTFVSRPWGWTVAAAGLLGLVLMQAIAPGLTYVAAPDEGGTGAVDDPGPLYGVLVGGLVAAQCVLAFVFSRDYRRMADGPQRSSLFVMIVGFGIYPIHRGTQYVVGILTQRHHIDGAYLPETWDPASTQLFLFGVVQILSLLVTLAGFMLVLPTLRGPARMRRRWALVLATGYAMAVGIGRAFALSLDLPSAFFFGLAVLPLPLLVTYALVRLQLFDLDLRLKWTLKQSTVAAIFVAVFFVVSEASQTFFAERAGSTYLGIAAASGLVFAMAPLQRLAERVSDAAMPGARSSKALTLAQKRELFLEAHRAAWMDGVLSRDERNLLERLQRHLGIGDAEAMRIEREAAQRGGNAGLK